MKDARCIRLIDTATDVADQLRVVACIDYFTVGGSESATCGLKKLLYGLADSLSEATDSWGSDSEAGDAA